MSVGHWASAMVPLLVSYGCVLAIPGPNAFVVIAASCDRLRRKASLAAAGVAAGATTAAAIAASGAALVPHGTAFQALGGIAVALILLRSAIRLGRGVARRPSVATPDVSAASFRSLLLGFSVALSNPMSIAYFASFFLAHDLRGAGAIPACCAVFIIAGTWFTVLGLAARRLRTVQWPASFARMCRVGAIIGLVSLASRLLWRVAFAA